MLKQIIALNAIKEAFNRENEPTKWDSKALGEVREALKFLEACAQGTPGRERVVERMKFGVSESLVGFSYNAETAKRQLDILEKEILKNS